MPGANKFLFVVAKLLFVLMLCTPVFSKAEGLMFSSNDSLVAKRTSYDVFKTATPVFKDHLLIDFDLVLWDKNHLGYIFNVSDKNNSYSLSYINTDNTSYLNFNIDRVSNKLKIPLQDSQLKKHKWIKVKVDFNLLNNTVTLYIDNQRYQATDLDFGGELPGKLMFGKNQFYTEVPNMAIRNLSVSDNSSKYFFPLNEWKGNAVHNADGDAIGFVENPIWLINDSYFWKPVYNHTFNQVAGLNYDTLKQRLFVYKSDSLLTYDPQSGLSSATSYKNQLPVKMVLGKSLFNGKENKCYIYEAFYDKPYGKTSIAALDLNTLLWQEIGKATFPEQRHHHNSFFNNSQDSIYLFGGYGSFKYYNTFFRYNQSKDQWENVQFKGDRINPRFFSASGSAENKDEVFLFGGYGNQSGNQIIGGKQFYDLYRINLKTHTVKKCWNIQPEKEVFVPANNLILSADKKYFYVLCYPHEVAKTSIRLYKFSVKDGSYEVVSAPIAVTSEKIETDINLFYNNKADEFYCAIQEFTNPLNSKIKVYALSAPPVSRENYLAAIAPKKKTSSSLLYVAIACIVLIGLPIIFLWKKKRKPGFTAAITEDGDMPLIESGHQIKANAVYLLGEFTVLDKNSRDITYLFSPKIKQLFLLILLNSRNGKGISSKKISLTLWPDKDIAKTKNIKGVTFNHLRNSIADIKGLQLLFVNDTYLFETDGTFFCDYFVIYDQLNNTAIDNDRLIDEYYDLISRGGLLSEMADQWVDDFKRTYDERLMEALSPQLDKLYKEKNFKLVLEISRLILHIDPFNDNAFKYELKSCKTTKGIEHSKKIYDHFTQEYSKSLGEDYPISFEKALQ
jgi:two-component SAPR family response regulator